MARYKRHQRTAKYSHEFKVSAVLLSNFNTSTVKSIAESLDIHPAQFPIWHRQYREGLGMYAFLLRE